LQATPPGQSLGLEQPHAPLTHAVPLMLLVQSTHAEAEPHAVDAVPVMHVPIEPPQQKAAPQAPPSQLALQAPPVQVGVWPPHAMHAVPAEPQCVPRLPGTHVVPSQHPPLHVRPPAQLVEHTPLLGSHASPLGQLAGVQDDCVSAPASCDESAVWASWASTGPIPTSPVASGAPPSLTALSTTDRSVTPTIAAHAVPSAAAAIAAAAAHCSARPILKPSRQCYPTVPRPGRVDPRLSLHHPHFPTLA
jgi:hypothetical protein